MSARARRLLALGQGLTLLALGVGAAAAVALPGQYGGGLITLRPFMVSTSTVVAGVTALALWVSAAGVLGRSRWAATAWFVGGAAALVHAAWPVVAGVGPWAPDSLSPRVLTALAGTPALLRAGGSAAFGQGLGGRLGWGITALAVADLLAVGWWVARTPLEVMARAHPGDGTAALWVGAVGVAVLIAGSTRGDAG